MATTMKKFRFLEWDVYRDTRELFSLILEIVKKLPKEYRYELGSQVIRSAFSVILNMAEGSGKNSDVELNRFINISLGSLNETLAATDVLRYNKFVTEKEFANIYGKIDSISNRLGGFKKKLVVSNKS
jgi:four helix bundle protein